MLRALTDVDQDATLEFDVCVVGAGAAGITLAHRLRSSNLEVALLEAGGFERPEIGPEHPYRGENAGRRYSLLATRLRYFGGTTNHWGGWCRPLDELDFRKRPHIPLSGWPFGREELIDHYREAGRYCQIHPLGWELSGMPHGGRRPEIFFGHYDPDFVAKQFRFSPGTRFGEVYRPDLETSPSTHCFIDSTAAEIGVEDGRVAWLAVRGPGEKRYRVRARAYVLAMGAIENARLLLHSDGSSRRGVGNESDWVGRCFADHPGWTIGRLQSRYPLPYVLYERRGIRLLPHLSLRDEVLERQGMVNFGLMCLPNPAKVPLPIESTPGTARGEIEDARDLEAEIERADSRRARALRRVPELRVPEWGHFHKVLARLEAVPNRASRITLTRDRDPYGVRRVRLDWRLDGIELDTLDTLSDLLGRRIGAHGLGRYQRLFDRDELERVNTFYQSHQMGTTRMSARPEDGVVNADGRVHTVSNLYMAGGSVFPTFGFTNPTLTIVALAVRLADHLRASLGGT